MKPAKRGVGSLRRLVHAAAVLAGLGAAVQAGPAAAAPAALFGTAEFRGESHAALPQWRRVLAEMAREIAGHPGLRARRGAVPQPCHHGLARPAARARAGNAPAPGPGGQCLRQSLAVQGRCRQLRPAGLLGDAARVLPPLGRLRGLRDRQVSVPAAARAAARGIAPGRGAGHGARPAARGAGGLPGGRGLYPGQSDRWGAAAAAGRQLRALLFGQRGHPLGPHPARRGGRHRQRADVAPARP